LKKSLYTEVKAMKKRSIGACLFCVAAVCVAAVFLTATANFASAAWAPSKPVEFVVQAAPGGGSDIMARTIASIAEAEKLSPVPLVVVNKPGGGSVVGTTYVAQQKGNPLVLATYHTGNLVAPIAAGVEAAMVKNLTVLVGLALDEQLIVVKADAPYQTLKDLVAGAKDKGGAMSVGGTTTGQDDHICNRLFERSAGIKTRYVSFNSGGEVMTALLGGHVDYIWANPAEFAPQLDAKQVRPLGVAKEERIAYLSAVPTIKEQGYDVVWKMFRGIIAPSGIPADAIAFYEGMFKRLGDSSKWKEGYINRYMLTPTWMGHQEIAKFVIEQETLCVSVLKELGLVK
jgi:putative tricarboxylic transport membrane protein